MDSAFPLTPWSSILRGEELGDEARRETLRRLLRGYWKPLYHCVRFGWRLEPELATQRLEEFFWLLLHTDLIRGLDPEKGRFREFLKNRLHEFMATVGERTEEAPRETGIADLGEAGHDDRATGEPQEVFDSSWVELLVERALGRFDEQTAGEATGELFAVFKKVDLEPGDRPLGEVAAELGIDTDRLADRLHEARKHFRRVMVEEIHEYALDDVDAREELRWTIG